MSLEWNQIQWHDVVPGIKARIEDIDKFSVTKGDNAGKQFAHFYPDIDYNAKQKAFAEKLNVLWEPEKKKLVTLIDRTREGTDAEKASAVRDVESFLKGNRVELKSADGKATQEFLLNVKDGEGKEANEAFIKAYNELHAEVNKAAGKITGPLSKLKTSGFVEAVKSNSEQLKIWDALARKEHGFAMGARYVGVGAAIGMGMDALARSENSEGEKRSTGWRVTEAAAALIAGVAAFTVGSAVKFAR